jgi:hypothetical protein
MQPPSDTTPTYFKSEGGGQYFKGFFELNPDTNEIEKKVKIVCLYYFNPSVEITKYSADLIAALSCEDCTAEEFQDAQNQALKMLQ